MDRRKGRFHVREFESEFATYLNSKAAVAVNSGTAALNVALRAAGVGSGDEVITQAFTFIATVEAILDVGATPIIAQVDDTLNLCPIDLEKKSPCAQRLLFQCICMVFPPI